MLKRGESFLRNHPQDFSLVLGGPVFQLLGRSHLTDDTLGLAQQRIIVISLFCWLSAHSAGDPSLQHADRPTSSARFALFAECGRLTGFTVC